jgi:hypothetical protein
VTVVPVGTVTEAGLKAKFWMVTAAAGGAMVVAGAMVEAGGGWVVMTAVTVAAAVVAVAAGAAEVVGGGGVAEGAVQPDARIAARITMARAANPALCTCLVIQVPHGMITRDLLN